jgi:hypothetical protein
MADWKEAPTLIVCPNCRKPLVLFSIENYPRLAHMSSGELGDLPGDIHSEIRGAIEATDAKFAVVDRSDEYLCRWCGTTQTFRP